MDTLFTVIFILILSFSLYSVIIAFIKKSGYKNWLSSVNATGKVIKTESLQDKSTKLSLSVRYNGADFPLELIVSKKRAKALNLEVGSYLPLVYNEETNEIKNSEYLRDEYKKHFYHSWVFFLFFCIVFILFVEYFGGALSERDFYKYIGNFEEFRP